MIRRAGTAETDAASFREQAAQRGNQMAVFYRLLENPASRNSTTAPAENVDYADIWAHHWVNTDNPHTTLDITLREPGTKAW